MALLSVHGCEFWSLSRHSSSQIRPPQTVLAIWIRGETEHGETRKKFAEHCEKFMYRKKWRFIWVKSWGVVRRGEWFANRRIYVIRGIRIKVKELFPGWTTWNRAKLFEITITDEIFPLKVSGFVGRTRSTLACAFTSRRTEKNER